MTARGPYRKRPPEDRLMEKVEVVGECWVWRGGTKPNGYGMFWYLGKMSIAHRAAYELFIGPIPQEMQIDHLCRTRLCVNPAHLEPVTQTENIRRGLRGRLKTHCPQGHPLVKVNAAGHRYCGVCKRQRMRERSKRS